MHNRFSTHNKRIKYISHIFMYATMVYYQIPYMTLWSTITKQTIYGVPPNASIRDVINSRCRWRVHAESLFCIIELERRRRNLWILPASWAVFGSECRRKSGFFIQIGLFDTEGSSTCSAPEQNKGQRVLGWLELTPVQYVTNSKHAKLTDNSKDRPKQEKKEL